MSGKKKAFEDWVDKIGESNLPVDEFTFTEGSNYGLDGFAHDKPMNEGVEQGARLPSVKGLSGLPDGFVSNPEASALPDDDLADEKRGFNLEVMLSEEEGGLPLSKEAQEAAKLVDLSWLDPTQEQDPDRLPKGLKPEEENANNAIPELVEAWGAGKQTNGIRLVPGVKEREVAKYEKSIAEGPKSGLPGTKNASAENLRDVIFRAMRRSVFGHPLAQIKAEVARSLGHDAYRVKKAMALIESEHGLAGRVFIRANAFPGLKKGRWVQELRKVAKTARYVITDDSAIADKLKMEMVSEVPWKKALRHYGPLLKASGYRLASEGDERSILRSAFLAGPEATSAPSSNKPVDVRPAERVSAEEAKLAFYSAPAEERKVITQDQQRTAAERKRALLQLAKWVQAGLLSQKDALRIQASSASALMLLKTGARLIAASGHAVPYTGTGTLLPKVASVSREEAWSALRTAETKAQEEEKALEDHKLKKLKVHVARMVKGGLMTKVEAERLLALKKPAETLYKMAAAVALQREKSAGAEIQVPKAEAYKGSVFKAAPLQETASIELTAEEKRVMEAAKGSGEKPETLAKVLRFTRQQMSEGMAGEDLDAMLKAKYAQPLRKAAKSLLKVLRDEHEGLAGHLYVDASAYMSKSGTEGCESGALKHRTNGLKYVLAADRCGNCVHATEGRCGLYRKKLVDEPPVADPKGYQRKILAATKASDAEITASYFNPGEFDLTDPLEGFDLEDTTPTESLGEILFGEMQV